MSVKWHKHLPESIPCPLSIRALPYPVSPFPLVRRKELIVIDIDHVASLRGYCVLPAKVERSERNGHIETTVRSLTTGASDWVLASRLVGIYGGVSAQSGLLAPLSPILLYSWVWYSCGSCGHLGLGKGSSAYFFHTHLNTLHLANLNIVFIPSASIRRRPCSKEVQCYHTINHSRPLVLLTAQTVS